MLAKNLRKDSVAKATLLAGRLPLVLCLVGLALGGVLGSVLAVKCYQNNVVDVRIDNVNRAAKAQANGAAGRIESYLSTLRYKLEAQLTVAYSDIVAADEAGFTRVQARFAAAIDDYTAVRFVRRGQGLQSDEGLPPIGFSLLSMINKVESGESVAVEAIKVNDHWWLIYVLPVRQGNHGVIDGSLVVATTDAPVKELLARDLDRLGRAQLQQHFSRGKPLTITAVGQGNPAYKPQLTTIKGTHWQVAFLPSEQLAERVAINFLMVYLVMALAVIVPVVVLAVAGRLLGFRFMNGWRVNAQSSVANSHVNGSSQRTSGQLTNPLYQNQNILDVEIKEEDHQLLPLEDVPDECHDDEADILDIDDSQVTHSSIPDVIFRAYDIRGVFDSQITKELAQSIGQALGSEALDQREDTLIVARDARTHSPFLAEYLVRGILASGCNVLNIGTVPTPLMYFACEILEQSKSGVMVTASHNPAQYNGFKVVMGGKARSGDDIKAIRERILKDELYQGVGQESKLDLIPRYIDTIFSDVALAGEVNIVVDAGNGVTGIVAPQLFEELGCNVIPLFCDLNGEFPNHEPDPSDAVNLQPLIAKVRETGADMGVAFDGDGDRLAVVTPKGDIIWPDRLTMLFAKDILSRNPGSDVIFDVKSSRHLAACITQNGGLPVMWKTGHSLMKSKMQETGALLGGEYSGHIFIKDRWYGFDDGMYAAARLLEITTLMGRSLDDIMAEFPNSLATPEIRVAVDDDKKFDIMNRLIQQGDFAGGKKVTIDGIRVDYAKGWGLVRASNTSAHLTLRFEADNEEVLHKLKSLFVRELRRVENSITVDWANN